MSALRLSDREFASLFTSFERSAFRLETLAEYRVDDEAEAFAAFLAGRPLPESTNSGWLEFLAGATTAGKIVERVHALPSRLTPYLRFEVAWGYAYSAVKGERIFLLEHDDPASLFDDLPYGDFWLFDETIVVQMSYDRRGSFQGASKARRDKLGGYLQSRDRARGNSIPLEAYLAQDRTRRAGDE